MVDLSYLWVYIGVLYLLMVRLRLKNEEEKILYVDWFGLFLF